jgi:haloacid dehalogenase-like hydrolase
MTKLFTKLKEEFFKLLPPTIFFFVALHIVAFVRVLMLKGTGISPLSSMSLKAMKTRRRQNFVTAAFAWIVVLITINAQASDPLPSWNDGKAKQSITEFVTKVTKEGSPDFVPPAERIATFDNDGTLWCEQPMYFQLFFALDRVKALAPQHPEWKTKEPFASLLKGDVKGALAGGEHAILEIIVATHAGVTTAEFEKIVADWIATAKHPKFKRPYTECVYQPMIELLAYLRANGFKTFIVSGGGIEFMRPWTEKVYGIPPEQVVGSSIKTKYEMRDGKPVLMRLPEMNFIDDKAGKPVGINSHIGRRPIAAFGNSDGDQQMLEWTQAGSGARLMMLVHHDDAVREFAYGAESKIGTFSDALMAEAKKDGWTVISMKDDWKQIFAFENK